VGNTAIYFNPSLVPVNRCAVSSVNKSHGVKIYPNINLGLKTLDNWLNLWIFFMNFKNSVCYQKILKVIVASLTSFCIHFIWNLSGVNIYPQASSDGLKKDKNLYVWNMYYNYTTIINWVNTVKYNDCHLIFRSFITYISMSSL